MLLATISDAFNVESEFQLNIIMILSSWNPQTMKKYSRTELQHQQKSFHHKLCGARKVRHRVTQTHWKQPWTYLKNDRLAFRLWNFTENRIHDVEKFLPRKLSWRIAIEIIDEIVQQEICACGWEKSVKIYCFKLKVFKVENCFRSAFLFPGWTEKLTEKRGENFIKKFCLMFILTFTRTGKNFSLMR